jgi:hypothetical protein
MLLVAPSDGQARRDTPGSLTTAYLRDTRERASNRSIGAFGTVPRGPGYEPIFRRA